MATKKQKTNERRIKFLSRDLPFPTDPSFREYRVIEELTGKTAEEIMSGAAGVWMLPILAITAMMRADKNVTHEQLDKLLDLGPNDIEIIGLNLDDPEEAEVPLEESQSTGTPSTDETPEPSGTPDTSTS